MDIHSIHFGINWKTTTVEEIAGVDVNARDEDSRTPLHEAAENNENLAVIEALVNAGAEVNAWDEDGQTPANLAHRNENSAVTEALVKASADINTQTKHWKAAANKNPAVIEALVKKAGTDVNTRTKNSWTPLHPAAIEALLKASANPNVKDNRGKTPIDYIDEDENHPLKNTSAYRMLNNARYNKPVNSGQ